jgi:hypothetical protein
VGFGGGLHAAGDDVSVSLFQSSQEQKQISDAFDVQKKTKDAPPPAPEPEKMHHVLYALNAILYTNDTSWSVWVGASVFNQNHTHLSDTMSVRALNPRTVEIMDGDHKVILFVGQSYDQKRKAVISGRGE